MNYRESILSLNKKFEWLASCWGNKYHIKAGIVLDRGTLWIRKKDKTWLFILEEVHGKKLIPIQHASIEARLDVAHALPDLLREIQNNHINRIGDIEEAHAMLDNLLQDAKE